MRKPDILILCRTDSWGTGLRKPYKDDEEEDRLVSGFWSNCLLEDSTDF